ncbi:MAG: hypothetical protein JWN45_2500 [Acidobacteriaceae bacterium]|nr:hypothetical protein [Acidobacteriaceae bacterium]
MTVLSLRSRSGALFLGLFFVIFQATTYGQIRQDHRDTIRRFLKDIYPALAGQPLQLTLSERSNFNDVKGNSSYAVRLEKSNNHGLEPGGFPTTSTPCAMVSQLLDVCGNGSAASDENVILRGRFGFSGGRLVSFVGGSVETERKNLHFRNQVTQNPEWNEQQMIEEAERQGAKFAGSKCRFALNPGDSAALKSLLGPFWVKSIKFIARQGAEPFYCSVDAVSERNADLSMSFAFEPFEGELVSLNQLLTAHIPKTQSTRAFRFHKKQ